MEEITKKLHRNVYIEIMEKIDKKLIDDNFDNDLFWELDRLFFQNVNFTMNNSFKLINFQMKFKISNGA